MIKSQPKVYLYNNIVQNRACNDKLKDILPNTLTFSILHKHKKKNRNVEFPHSYSTLLGNFK